MNLKKPKRPIFCNAGSICEATYLSLYFLFVQQSNRNREPSPCSIFVFYLCISGRHAGRQAAYCVLLLDVHRRRSCMLPCRWTALTGRLGCGSLVYIHDACFPNPISNHWLLIRFVPVRCYGSWNIFNAVGNIKRFLTNFTKFWIRWATNKSQTIHILQRITFQWPKIKKRQSNRANIIKSHPFDINDEYKSIFHHFFLLYWKRNWEKLKLS